jgi:CTP synthase
MAKLYFCNGRRCIGVGQGHHGRVSGALLKRARAEGCSAEARPYINVDPGTMSPFQHGEVFVTEDGAETNDLVWVTTSAFSTRI